MSRSSYKLEYAHKKVLKTVKLIKFSEGTSRSGVIGRDVVKIRELLQKRARFFFRIYKKGSTIPRSFINNKTYIHDGLYFQHLQITEALIKFTRKFGEFVFTKRTGAFIHKDNKIAKKKAKILRQLAAKASARKKRKGGVSKKKK